MNTTVITHFYNEEYLLPWWLKHHQKLFENGILIDYNSTDRSVEICKDLAPNWKVVTSKNSMFGAIDADNEVMEYEETVEGYKMALNITEFFFPYCSIEQLDLEIRTRGSSGIRTYGVFMVDENPENLPTYDKSLIEQKHYGMISGYVARDDGYGQLEPDYFKIYGRFLHRDFTGSYQPGRHNSNHSYPDMFNVFTLKYKYCPWNDFTISRIQQFKDRIPQGDISMNAGTQHLKSEEEYRNRYYDASLTAVDLTLDENFSKAYNYCMSL